MLYPNCPTCGTELSNKQIPHEEGMDKICKDTTLSEEERNNKKRKLLDDLELRRMCCRMRMMGYEKLIEKIK